MQERRTADVSEKSSTLQPAVSQAPLRSFMAKQVIPFVVAFTCSTAWSQAPTTASSPPTMTGVSVSAPASSYAPERAYAHDEQHARPLAPPLLCTYYLARTSRFSREAPPRLQYKLTGNERFAGGVYNPVFSGTSRRLVEGVSGAILGRLAMAVSARAERIVEPNGANSSPTTSRNENGCAYERANRGFGGSSPGRQVLDPKKGPDPVCLHPRRGRPRTRRPCTGRPGSRPQAGSGFSRPRER